MLNIGYLIQLVAPDLRLCAEVMVTEINSFNCSRRLLMKDKITICNFETLIPAFRFAGYREMDSVTLWF